MTMSDLAEFLLARIAEDEAELEAAIQSRYPGLTIRRNPSRVIAECEAKRALLALHTEGWDGRCGECSDRYAVTPWDGLCDEARILATVYADHPDYREEWAA